MAATAMTPRLSQGLQAQRLPGLSWVPEKQATWTGANSHLSHRQGRKAQGCQIIFQFSEKILT